MGRSMLLEYKGKTPKVSSSSECKVEQIQSFSPNGNRKPVRGGNSLN
jgi:hypothetical protein